VANRGKPGAVSALIYGGLVILLAVTRKNFGPPITGFSWNQRFETLPVVYPVVIAGVRPECTVQDVFRGCMPFFVADFVTIAVLIALPGIVLWLPGLMGYS
jgi:TRAP-type C4-dicarboxylate transport system permease large subunit